MKAILGSFVLVLGLTANAGLLTLTEGNKKIETVTLNQSALVTGSDVTMTLVGAGLRAKTVLFVPAKVYVAELFSNAPQAFSRDQNALKSLEQSTVTAVRLTFLRSVDSATVASSYREALVANSISLKDAAVEAFLANVEKGGDAAAGKSFVMLMVLTKDGGTKFYYEDTKDQVTVVDGDRSLQQKVLSIWLGQPADSGLKTLKESLLKPVY